MQSNVIYFFKQIWFQKILGIFLAVFFQFFTLSAEIKKPRLSIITSIYNGDEFIEAFMEDITRQTLFDQCELIMINANSPGNEGVVVRKYLQRYPNIIYKELDQDPGLYAVWNMGIKMASSDLISNANLDDRSKIDSYEKHVEFIESNPDIDLVYSDYYVTKVKNAKFEDGKYLGHVKPQEFSAKIMNLCLPGCRPVWRKSMHLSCGYFDETFKIIGDWEMWNRAAKHGKIFKKMEGCYTTFLVHENGLTSSTSPESLNLRKAETIRVVEAYKGMWGG